MVFWRAGGGSFLASAADLRLSIALFRARVADRLEIGCNGRVLTSPEVKEDWHDPQIFSPLPQPNSGGKGEYPARPNQQLLRLTYALPPAWLRRGENLIQLRVLDRPAFRIGEDLQVEKVELALRYPGA